MTAILWMSIASIDAFGCLFAQEKLDTSFETLGLLEQRDFVALVQELYVYGTASQSQGVFGRQSEIIIEIDHALLLESDDYANALTDSLLDNIQPATDARFQFKKLIDENPGILIDYYRQARESLPPDLNPSFENIMRRLSLELDQKSFLARWPSIAEHTPYPGLRGYALKAYRDFLPVEQRHRLSDEIIRKLDSNDLLSFDEFLPLAPATLSPEQLKEIYEMYKSFGWIPYAKNFSETQYFDRLESTIESPVKERMIKIASRLRDSTLRVRADFTSKTDDFLTGVQWVLKMYSSKIPRIDRSLESGMESGNPYYRFQRDIDDWVVDLSDGESSLNFRKSIEDIERGSWVYLSSQNFDYYKLSPELRRLLSARMFPDLSIREGMALIEKNLFDLSETERLSILNAALPNVGDAETIYQRFNSLPLKIASPAMDEIVRDIVKYYTERDDEVLIPSSYLLLDGETSVPAIEPLREEMRLMIYQNRDQIDSGIYPRSFIEELMIRFYPTDDHIANEKKRFWNEWNRRELIDESLKKATTLHDQILLSKDENEKSLLTEELTKEIEALNLRLIQSPIDIDSEFSILGAFSYGLVPHDFSDWKGVAKMAGAGIAFVTVIRLSGMKRLGTFIFADTGLHYVTGYSTWIGLWTAQGIDETLSRLVRLANPSSADDRMLAAEELGRMSRDAIAFGLGADLLRLTSSAVRLKARREARASARQIQRLKTAIAEHQTKIVEINKALSPLKESLSTLRRAGLENTAKARELKSKVSSLESEISLLEGITSRSQTRIGFYSQALLRASLRGIDFMIPGRSRVDGASKESLWKLFDRRRSLGIRNFEAAVQALELKLVRTDRRVSGWEQLSANPFKRLIQYLKFEPQRMRLAMNRYASRQSEIAEKVLDSENLLSAKQFTSASESLEAATQRFATQMSELEGFARTMSPRPTTFMERQFFKLDDYLQREARPLIDRSRPIESPSMSTGDAQRRLMDNLRLNARDQVKALEDSVQRIRQSVQASPEDIRLATETNLRNTESHIASARRSLEKIRIKD